MKASWNLKKAQSRLKFKPKFRSLSLHLSNNDGESKVSIIRLLNKYGNVCLAKKKPPIKWDISACDEFNF